MKGGGGGKKTAKYKDRKRWKKRGRKGAVWEEQIRVTYSLVTVSVIKLSVLLIEKVW